MPIMESHLGLVTKTDADTEKRYGIEFQSDTLFDGDIFPQLAFPIFPINQIGMPEIGTVCEILSLADDLDGEPGETELGALYADFVFYTGRIFSNGNVDIPSELKTNYPKRSGLFWNIDGTILYYDATKNAKQFVIKLTDGKTFIQLKEDEVLLTQDQVTIKMKADEIIDTASMIKLGSEAASSLVALAPLVKAQLDLIVPHTHTFAGTTSAPVPATPGTCAGTTGPSSYVAGDVAATKVKAE